MILKAIERGVSEERIAKALDVDVAHIRRKRRLLEGICPEVAQLLADKHVSINTFWELKKLGPLRQLEAAELMVAMNKYTTGYAKSLVAATPQAQLAESNRHGIRCPWMRTQGATHSSRRRLGSESQTQSEPPILVVAALRDVAVEPEPAAQDHTGAGRRRRRAGSFQIPPHTGTHRDARGHLVLAP